MNRTMEILNQTWQWLRERRVPRGALPTLAALAGALAGTWMLVLHPPLATVAPGELVVRSNRLTGGADTFREGALWVLPAVHQLRPLPLRDQLYQPARGRRADGEAPFQSVEGLSIGVDLAVRYAVDPAQAARIARTLPPDLGHEVVEPAVQGIVYRQFSRYTVREIFSAKRAEIQAAIEGELRPRLAADGLLLRSVQIGNVDLPADFRRGMDRLLAEELEAEKMQHTLALKAKQVKQTELEAQADKARRETAAAAAAAEQVIAAKAQEEAMRHVLPFKQKQIEQRQLEAEAAKVARLKAAEAQAEARRIEAAAEADARQKLAAAEAWRADRLGQVAAAQMAREGRLLSRHPLLIHKAVADKLSDKVQVIIAPPGTDGELVTAGLVGRLPRAEAPVEGEQDEGEPQ